MFQPLFGPIKQWGFLVKDLETAMASWVQQLGVGPWWGYRNVPMRALMNGASTDIVINVGLAFQNGVQIELIQQVNDAESPYRAFYHTEHAQQLHQLAYMVPDVEAAVAQAQAAGMREHGRVITGAGQPYV
jgi:4-hydroxyphenylpyruvate dioxygenase-like putative hemolysin